MTPQERELITELFDRLASLERNPRDGEAEAAIREGLQRAPNAIYALVQTVLVQDEALKAANARIQEYEQGDQQTPEQPRSFLDTMRDQLLGRDEPRGSVPRVPQGGVPQATAPYGYRADARPDPWGRDAPPPAQSSFGGSFLGTAAAAAAGVIGGSLLMGGIRSALGGYQSGPFAGTFDHLGARGPGSPWTGAADSDLAREAGINDIGSRHAAFGDTGEAQPAGLFDQAQQDAADDAADDAQDDVGFGDDTDAA